MSLIRSTSTNMARMETESDRPNPLAIPELISLVIDYVDAPSDLMNCSRVNSVWSAPALEKLYRGSVSDIRYRTPDIKELNSLYSASPEHFAEIFRSIKHITIAPRTPATIEIGNNDPMPIDYRNERRYVCDEECDILDDDTAVRSLLQPRGKGPTSLAIPFAFMKMKHGLSFLSDLIFQPDLKFLTLDRSYCPDLTINPGKRLSNLEALSIHRTNIEWGGEKREVKALAKWLLQCDLKVFQISQSDFHSTPLPRYGSRDMERILGALWRHRNLQALAFKIQCVRGYIGSICEHLEIEMGTPPWPRLKALYLDHPDQYWLNKLPTFDHLQIFESRGYFMELPNGIQNMAMSISRCKHFQVVDVEFIDVQDIGIILMIASGCPRLRQLRVDSAHAGFMSGDHFSRLLRALPHIEVLEVPLMFGMTPPTIHDLATFCPKLEVLVMPRTRLHVTLHSLMKTTPLCLLAEMRMANVLFNDPERHKEQVDMQHLAKEWSRVFPRLRRAPLPYWVGESEGLIDQELRRKVTEIGSHGQSTIGVSKMPVNKLGVRPQLYSTDSRIRRQLWASLKYESSVHPKDFTGYGRRWRTDFEIQAFGWPVIPIQGFLGSKILDQVVYSA